MDGLLRNSHVRMKNAERTLAKLKRLFEGGRDHLQVISDFDFTLSRSVNERGDRLLTTHGIFDIEVGHANAELGKTLTALRDKYMPIEFHPDMSISEKIPHMETWWSTAHRMICEGGFTYDVLQSFVRRAIAEDRIELRRGCGVFLHELESAGVPLVLFSAGIADMIEIYLRYTLKAIPSNMHLISNRIRFDEQHVAVGFDEPLIHTFNKNGSVVSGKEQAFFHRLRDRRNVLLLGDSLGDIHMDVGVENEGDVVRVGFLNFCADKLLPQYLDGYDIVLLNDQTFDVPLAILRRLNADRLP